MSMHGMVRADNSEKIWVTQRTKGRSVKGGAAAVKSPLK